MTSSCLRKNETMMSKDKSFLQHSFGNKRMEI